jgi:hypothetical protein
MHRRNALVVAGWVVAAVAATGAGLAAVRVIGDGIGAGPAADVVSAERVARDLAAATPAPVPTSTTARPDGAASTGPGSPGPSVTTPAGARKVDLTPGGTVIAECAGPNVRLVTVSPAQGFGVQRQDSEPDDHARVIFAGGGGGRIEVDVRCRAGQPTITWKRHD